MTVAPRVAGLAADGYFQRLAWRDHGVQQVVAVQRLGEGKKTSNEEKREALKDKYIDTLRTSQTPGKASSLETNRDK